MDSKKQDLLYAGVGPRTSPEWVLAVMRRLGRYMAQQDYTLSSGHAKGADLAFEYGCDLVNGPKRIFPPDPLKGHPLQRILWHLASYANPRFQYLGEYKQYPLLRNPLILFGNDLSHPVALAITWMPGEPSTWTGGTANTMRLLMGYNGGALPGQKAKPEKPIGLVNLAKEATLMEILEKLQWDYGDLKQTYGLGVPVVKELWTVGYGNYSWAQFQQLLIGHQIKHLVDVRSKPYGRAEFRQDVLTSQLEASGITYTHRPELGGYPQLPAKAHLYGEDGRPDYERMAQDPELLATLEGVITQLTDEHTVLMCSERDYHVCHRSLLLSPLLRQRGVAVHHIVTPRQADS